MQFKSNIFNKQFAQKSFSSKNKNRHENLLAADHMIDAIVNSSNINENLKIINNFNLLFDFDKSDDVIKNDYARPNRN